MPQKTLNLGILAHVDAGKTTLTERLLFAAGAIAEVGSVDAGTTQTDTLELEQRRGITIKAAVVSFEIGDVTVNLIDTPGHPDFIAEVERALIVLDGAVLVVSAVEGVQSQTRLLMRALQRLNIPTILFVNKIDRRGADYERVLDAISRRLTPSIVPMGRVERIETKSAQFRPWGPETAAFTMRLAEVLAERNEAILEAYVEDDGDLTNVRLREELVSQTHQGLVHPVFFGSAITGAGVDSLKEALPELLPARAGDVEGSVSGAVFKIDRGDSGEKVAYARMFSGTLRVRDRIHLAGGGEDKITAVRVFERGSDTQADSVSAGQIGKLWGLREIQIGDRIGDVPRATTRHRFPPPMLESVVVPDTPEDAARLRAALAQLAEQDPLINVRQNDDRREISVSLYGEVQKEVIQATLGEEYGIGVSFRETTPLYVERPTGSGEAMEVLHAETNPFLATIGLRVEPAPEGSGVEFRLAVGTRTIPLYLYKTTASFAASMEHYVAETLREGLFGWEVTDVLVTMTKCVYSVPDGPPSRRGPLSTAADFRKLTPLVMMEALDAAGTVVCEPVVHVRLEVPTATMNLVLPALARLGASVQAPSQHPELSVIETELPVTRLQELQRGLPALTSGEGVLEFDPAGHQPVSGEQPTRARTTANPLNRDEYMMHLAGRVSSG